MDSIERDRLIYIRKKLRELVDEEEKSSKDYTNMAADVTREGIMELVGLLLRVVGDEIRHKVWLEGEIQKIDDRLNEPERAPKFTLNSYVTTSDGITGIIVDIQDRGTYFDYMISFHPNDDESVTTNIWQGEGSLQLAFTRPSTIY